MDVYPVQQLIGTEPDFYRVKIEKIREELEKIDKEENLFFIRLLINRLNDDTSPDDLESFLELFEILEEVIDHFEITKRNTQIWENVTGIYPVLKNLENQNFIVRLKDKEIVDGRLRTNYTITEEGLDYLRQILFVVSGITTSLFTSDIDPMVLAPDKVMKFGESQRSILHLLGKVGIDEDLLIRLLSNRNQLHVNQGIYLVALYKIRDDPKYLRELISQAQTEREKKIMRFFFEKQLTELKDSITKALEFLET
jgi:DNA-binding PadR family transcriptional regulator